jgi:hypothetical protein
MAAEDYYSLCGGIAGSISVAFDGETAMLAANPLCQNKQNNRKET